MNDLIKTNMRARFAYEIHKHMKRNKKIYLVISDLGYKMWDEIRMDFPERFLNAGASEQAQIGIAVGLALSKKIPIAYSISSFLLFRPFETIRNYINYEKIPVKLIGSGRNQDYMHDGISHWASEDKQVMKIFTNIKCAWPEKIEDIPNIVDKLISDENPWYINLKR